MNDTTPNTIFLVPIISAGVSFDVTSMLQSISAAYKTAGLSAAVQELDISTVQIEQYLIDDNLDDLLQHIAGRKQPPAGCDVLITAGLIPDAAQPYVGQFNAAVAQALDAEVVFVACQEHASLQQMIEINAWSFGGVSSDRVKGCIVAEGDRSCVTHLPLDLIGTVDPGGTIEFDADALSRLAQTGRERRLSPPMFRHAISEAARAANKRIVLPEGDEPRTIEAAAICQRAGFARCVLLGSRDSITQVAAERGIDLPDDIEIVDPAEIRHSYIDLLVELRQHKGMTAEKAASQLEDNVMLGTLMLYKGEVDGLVSGAVHTTANTIRPALQLIKIRPGEALVSSVFFMCLPDQVLVYADCGINPDPSIEQLADIAIQSADTAAAFGIRPRVALTSYSTGDSAAGEMIDKVRQATQIARTKRPDLLLDGPLQYDAATVPSVAAKKAPNSPIGGRATVLIFPDLDAGNIVYKAVQRSANVVSMGPVLQGLRKPVNDLSRGSLVDDIVYTIVITCVQATQS